MDRYCVNTQQQQTGEHEVHKVTCTWAPALYNQRDLGYHYTCTSAVAEAKKYYYSVDGCYFCSLACHTR
jgi:hypothetical protein